MLVVERLAKRVCGCLLLLVAAGVARAEKAPLNERHETWLVEVDPLILGAEKRVFLSLTTDYQRDAFIDRFWRERDPHPETARNELKERYLGRVHEARALYGDLGDDRARIYLVHGEPAATEEVRCSGSYASAEMWYYQGSEQVSYEMLLIFLLPRDEPAFVWHPSADRSEMHISQASRCIGGDKLKVAASSIRARGLDWELAFQGMVAKPRPRNREWLATFQAFTTALPQDAKTFDAEISFDFPGRYQHRTVTQGMLTVPVESIALGESLGFRSYNFELTGEVVREGQLFENFRYKFSFPADTYLGIRLPLAFQRYLRPAEYELILRLEDLNGQSFFRYQEPLVVPRVENRFTRPTALDSQTARLFAEATAAVARGETSIRIVPPRSLLQRGLVRFDTLAVGDEINRVAFILDEQRLLTKNRPPYNVEIDLGEFPEPHALRVEALDADGSVVAFDEIQLNAAGERFAVKLLEPRQGISYSQSLLARSRVEIPRGQSLERLEYYLNDQLVATLYQAPFAQPIALPPAGRLTYVRSVAYLSDGRSAEDLVFINAPDHVESIDVQMVELYTTVLDTFGRPVLGLERTDFEIFEDKVRQELIKFETVEDQAIHVGILFDNSASMGPLLDHTRVAALRFFQEAITPRDRAAVITFNRMPRLAVPLTNDLRMLGGGLAGLTAEGETALYDSVMFGLYYFAGVRGQRALLLLSDGKDEASRFDFEETLDYARRAGVTLLPILRNTVTGIAGVDPALTEAARAVGMTPWQQLRRVELPLAMPVIVAGLRTATVWTVGVATLSTPVGATSLGNYIFSGLQTRNYTAVLVGCVAAAVLALVLDGLVRGLSAGGARGPEAPGGGRGGRRRAVSLRRHHPRRGPRAAGRPSGGHRRQDLHRAVHPGQPHRRADRGGDRARDDAAPVARVDGRLRRPRGGRRRRLRGLLRHPLGQRAGPRHRGCRPRGGARGRRRPSPRQLRHRGGGDPWASRTPTRWRCAPTTRRRAA